MVDVTVIVAAWNAESTITAAIASALAQRDVDVEVIVADDASTDGTGAVLAAIADPRVRCVRLARNSGPAAARNAALALAEGGWIAVLDADDTMLPGRLALMRQAAASQGLDIITDNMWLVAGDGTQRLFTGETLDGAVETMGPEDYVRHNRMFRSGLGCGYLKPLLRADMLRRTAVTYDPGLRIGEDFLLVAEALVLGAKYGRIRTAQYRYTIGGPSLSRRLSVADAQAMVAADRRLLARHGNRMTVAEHAAWDSHLASLEDAAAFVAMVDSMKRRDLMAFQRHLRSRPLAARHFSMPIAARLRRAAQGLGVLRGPAVGVAAGGPA